MAFRVTAPELGGGLVVLPTWDALIAFLRDDIYQGYPERGVPQDPGPVTITLDNMSAADVAALPEFQGY